LINGTDKSWDFKCTADPNMILRVSRVRDIDGFLVSIGDGISGSRMVKLDGGEAAAMSMAVLEASGKCTGDRGSIYTRAASYLAQAATAEKAAQAQDQKLRDEALKLWATFEGVDSRGYNFEYMPEKDQARWLDVARTARGIS